MRKKLLFILLFISKLSFASVQVPDILVIGKDTSDLYDSPLLQIDKIDSLVSMYIGGDESSGCWRGFIAEWKIIDNRLYLSNLYNATGKINVNDRAEIILNKKFVNGLIDASWVSGEIWSGKKPITGDYIPTIYDEEFLFILDKGIVANRQNFKTKEYQTWNESYLESYFNLRFSNEIENAGKIWFWFYIYSNSKGEIVSVDFRSGEKGELLKDKAINAVKALKFISIYYYKGKPWTEGIAMQVLISKNLTRVRFG